jgi:hypothetical protein
MRIGSKALAVLAALCLLAGGAAAQAAGVGEPAPDFGAGGKWVNHESTTLADLRGHVVLVDFTRTW